MNTQCHKLQTTECPKSLEMGVRLPISQMRKVRLERSNSPKLTKAAASRPWVRNIHGLTPYAAAPACCGEGRHEKKN